MLILIGLGLNGLKSLSLEAIDVIKDADKVYVEIYTSPLAPDIVDELKRMVGEDKVESARRWMVEDGRHILSAAKVMDVAVLCYGDPLIATTHTELLARARSIGIDYKVIHNASAITSIIGSSGLHIYKLGRVTTLMSNVNPSSVYNAIFNNLMLGYHTLLLLEYDYESNRFLAPNDALSMLISDEHGVLSSDIFAVVVSRVGMDTERIVAGRIGSLLEYDFNDPPHAIIITGSLHFTEIEALKNLRIVLLDEPRDNTIALRTEAQMMLSRYIPRAKYAVKNALRMVEDCNIEAKHALKDILYNAEYYISDAESYARQCRYENAILALGYAEGLIDSIRYIVGKDPWES